MILPDNEPKPSSREARGFGFPAEVNDFHSLFPFPFFKFLPHYIPPFGFGHALRRYRILGYCRVGGAHLLTKRSVRRLKRPWVGLAAPTVRMSYSAARRDGHWSIWAEPVDLLSSPVEVTTTTCKMFTKMLTRCQRDLPSVKRIVGLMASRRKCRGS